MSRAAEVIALGEDMVFVELAEECCELAQIALKITRIRKGRSPMPEDAARIKLIEEMGDLLAEIRIAKQLLTPAEVLQVHRGSREKEQRMYDRLLGGKKS